MDETFLMHVVNCTHGRMRVGWYNIGFYLFIYLFAISRRAKLHVTMSSSLLMQPMWRCDTTATDAASHIIQAVQGKSKKNLFFPFLWEAFAKSALRSTFYPVNELLLKAWRSICVALQLPAAVIHHCINAGADCMSGHRWFRGSSHPPTTNGLLRCVADVFLGAVAAGGLGGEDEVEDVHPVFDTCLRVFQAHVNGGKTGEIEQSGRNKSMKRNLTLRK